MLLGGQRHPNRDFKFRFGIACRRHILSGQPHADHLDDIALRHAELRGLALQHMQNELARIGLDVVIDRDDILGGLKGLADFLADTHLPVHVRTIDFGQDRGHDRRSRRHFNHLGDPAVALADGLDTITQRHCDLMAFPRTVMLVG